jgi:hypothetical protein
LAYGRKYSWVAYGGKYSWVAYGRKMLGLFVLFVQSKSANVPHSQMKLQILHLALLIAMESPS